MKFHLFGQSLAVTLEDGDDFSGQTFLQRLPGLAITSFKDPLDSEPRPLLLTQSNGFVDVLSTVPMCQALNGWGGSENGFTQKWQRLASGERVKVEECTGCDASSFGTATVFHDAGGEVV